MRQFNGRILSLWLIAAALVGCDSSSTDEPAEHAEHAEPTEQAEHSAQAPDAPVKPEVAAPAEAAPSAMPAVPEGAKVLFAQPLADSKIVGPLKDGKVEVLVKMGAEGIEVKPAGEVVANTGHHHLLIDTDAVPMGQVVPKDDTHMHFGGGQTEASIALAPGSHSLSLQFADGIHRSYGPQLSQTIQVEVAAAE